MEKKSRDMEQTQKKSFRGLKLLILLVVVFLIGFECGRQSRGKEIQELEATAKSIGWWNMQLENEIEELEKQAI